jgi:hypothetical protein
MPEPEIPETAKFDSQALVDWLHNQDWNFVPEHKYETIGEHWYLAQSWFDGDEARIFKRVMNAINESPFTETYNGDDYNYLYCHEYKYWISNSFHSPGVMLNREEINPDHIQVTLDGI